MFIIIFPLAVLIKKIVCTWLLPYPMALWLYTLRTAGIWNKWMMMTTTTLSAVEHEMLNQLCVVSSIQKNSVCEKCFLLNMKFCNDYCTVNSACQRTIHRWAENFRSFGSVLDKNTGQKIVFFSDQAPFTWSRNVKSQVTRWWGFENPHTIHDVSLTWP